jgi:hypothetical protein
MPKMHLIGISPLKTLSPHGIHHLFLPCKIPMLSWIFCPFRITNYNLNITSPALDECAYRNMKNIKDDKDEYTGWVGWWELKNGRCLPDS